MKCATMMRYECKGRRPCLWPPGMLLAGLLICCGPALPAAVSPPIAPQPPPAATNVAAQVDLTWGAAPLDLIANGGFESGTLGGWTEEVQAPAGGMAINDGLTDPDGQGPDVVTPPALGRFNAVSVPMAPGRFGLYQNITIPADATSAVLRWSDRIRNFENNGTFLNAGLNLHTFRAELRNPSNNQILATMFQTENGDPPLADWTKRDFDLLPYRGQTVRIAFVTYVSLFFFSVHLDHVSLAVETARAPTNEVYFGTDTLQFQGRTTVNRWSLSSLPPDTAYQWRVIRRLDDASIIGPVWSFRTGPVGAVDHFAWSPIASPRISGQPWTVTVTARDARFNTVTSFDQAVELGVSSLAGAGDGHLLEDRPYAAYAAFRHATVGYAFTPNRDLWVHALRSFSGDEVSLWTEEGVRLASLRVTAQPGRWIETPLPEVVPLRKDRTYRITSYTGSTGLHYTHFDHGGAFAHGTLDQSYYGDGNGFPTQPHPARWWFVDLAYRTAQPDTLSPSPGTTTPFQNGQWTGSIFVTGASTSAVLRAVFGDRTSGLSQPFRLEPSPGDMDQDGMPDDWELEHGFLPGDATDADQDADGDGASNVAEYRAGTDPRRAESVFRVVDIRRTSTAIRLRFSSVAGRRYRVEKSNAPAGKPWQTVSDGLTGTGDLIDVSDDLEANEGRAFYRVALYP